MSTPSINIQEFLSDPEARVIIDVRSESEFAEAHIPGAYNVPILNDAERAEIGTIYKRQGGEEARRRGLELVGPKLASLVERIRYLSAGRSILVYCWRGGDRSKSVATILSLLRFDVVTLKGGHKAFRTFVQEYLNKPQYPFRLITIYGLTGSGKTEIIREWKGQGKPVIDLEGLAHHRGSAFGQVGIDQYGKQKEFENNLFWEMWKHKESPFVVVEGESQRIGRCMLPDSFMKQMQEGKHVRVDKSVDERVKHILHIYVEQLPRERLHREAQQSLDAIKKRLGGEKHKELSKMLVACDYAEFTRILLIDYYDKMYANSRATADFYQAVIRNAGDWPQVAELG